MHVISAAAADQRIIVALPAELAGAEQLPLVLSEHQLSELQEYKLATLLRNLFNTGLVLKVLLDNASGNLTLAIVVSINHNSALQALTEVLCKNHELGAPSGRQPLETFTECLNKLLE